MNTVADILIKNATLLTMDESFHIYEEGAIAISNGVILAVGPESEIISQYSAEDIIDAHGKVLMPGLINAHTHAPMTLLRGLADDLRLDVWLMGYMMPVEREFVSADFVHLGTQIACVELIRSGVTCFADMYYFEEHVARATAEAGLRAVCGQTVLKFPAPDAQTYEESLAAAREFIQNWKNHPLIIPAVAPHAPYTSTPEILQATTDLAIEFDVPLLTHLAETAQEVENSRNEHGMPVIPYIKNHGLLKARLVAAHCVHIDEGEMRTLQHYQAGVAHNPSSNLKLASGFAAVSKMLDIGINIGIGTDGPASNNDLDMFEEMRLAAFLAKSVANDPTALPARTALAMATRMGAQSLHIGDITGSLVPGKQADLILVNITPLHNSPRFRHDKQSIYAQLVYAGKSTDVSDVMVSGKWLMREGQLTTLDEGILLQKAADYSQRIDKFLVQREKSVLSKLIAIGGALEGESFEIQAKVRVPDSKTILEELNHKELEILYHRHYHEYDTYFFFADPSQGILRYREDEFLEQDQVERVRYRLTLIGQAREEQFPSDVLLSRSRFLAPATHSLRFYREYFQPLREIQIEKDRLRWRVIYRGTEFYINLDEIKQPPLGYFLEVKSRTWSRRDAEHKAHVASELIEYLVPSAIEMVAQDYLQLIDAVT